MKKIFKKIGRIFHHIGTFFDKILIAPITKLILIIKDFFKSHSGDIDKLAGRQSTLLIISLVLAYLVFLIISNESNVMIDKYAEILYEQPVTGV